MRQALLYSVLALALIAAATLGAVPAMAQMLTGPPADPQYKNSTPIPPSVPAPDKIETPFGEVRLNYGFPDKESTDKLYDNLDFQRAVQAYLLGLPPVSQWANRKGMLAWGRPTKRFRSSRP